MGPASLGTLWVGALLLSSPPPKVEPWFWGAESLWKRPVVAREQAASLTQADSLGLLRKNWGCL